MWSERKHGLSTEPVPVFACVGSSKNLKDLKDKLDRHRERKSERARQKDFFIVNLLVRIHLIIQMIERTGLAPW